MTEMEKLVKDIKKFTSNQNAINKADEVRVMKCMLNDPEYTVGVYEKKAGYVGERSPRKEAVNFVKNIIMGATGLDSNDSLHLAENYEFQKRDAVFLLDNMRDFTQTYMSTGRKMNIMQTSKTEADIFITDKPSMEKIVPDKNNPGQTKKTITSPYVKLVCKSKSPKYNTGKDE